MYLIAPLDWRDGEVEIDSVWTESSPLSPFHTPVRWEKWGTWNWDKGTEKWKRGVKVCGEWAQKGDQLTRQIVKTLIEE